MRLRPSYRAAPFYTTPCLSPKPPLPDDHSSERHHLDVEFGIGQPSLFKDGRKIVAARLPVDLDPGIAEVGHRVSSPPLATSTSRVHQLNNNTWRTARVMTSDELAGEPRSIQSRGLARLHMRDAAICNRIWPQAPRATRPAGPCLGGGGPVSFGLACPVGFSLPIVLRTYVLRTCTRLVPFLAPAQSWVPMPIHSRKGTRSRRKNTGTQKRKRCSQSW